LASNPKVQIDMAFTKTMSAGFFGGQGFVLQKLSGVGDVLVKGGGTIVVQDLSPGQVLRVSSSSIVAFESSVQYDVTMMKGISNVMFGGEGLFVTTLTGPGTVWLQGMPPDRMIAEIARRVPAGGFGFGIPVGLGGGGTSEAGGVDSSGGDEDAAAPSADIEATAADGSVEAERASTVATSAPVDSDSPTALFGDAAPDSRDMKYEPLSNSSSTTTEPTFDDDFSTSSSATTEATFDDQEFVTNGSDDFTDGKLFDDASSTSSTDGFSDSTPESSSSLFQTLWDFFTSDEDR
jgi:hypothetical protein